MLISGLCPVCLEDIITENGCPFCDEGVIIKSNLYLKP